MGARAAPTTEAPLSSFLDGFADALSMRSKTIDCPRAVLVAGDRINRMIAGIQAAAVSAAEGSGVIRDSGARSTASWVEKTTGESKRDAYAKSRVADAVAKTPSLGVGLLEGSLNAAQVEQIQATAESTKAEPEQIEKLIEDAKGESVKETERLSRQLEREINRETPEERYRQQRRKRSLGMRIRTDGSGMIEIYGQFDPIKGELIKAELLKAYKHLHGGETEKREPRQLMADALDYLLLTKTSKSSSGAGVDVVVTVTLDELTKELNATGKICGSGEQIPVSEIRRIACEQGIIPAILGSAGEVLDMGRKVRLATPAQKRALKIRHGGCGIPGCDASFEFTQIHHIKEWLQGGLTDLENLIPLCTRHHHLVHDDGWQILISQDGTIEFKSPRDPRPP